MGMESHISKFKDEIDELIVTGERLYFRLLFDLGVLDAETADKVSKRDLPGVKSGYESWYTRALQVIRQILPDRLSDFVRLYKDEKRKEIDHVTYGMSDYMLGLQTKRGLTVVVDDMSAIPKLSQQLDILKASRQGLDSVLFKMVEIVQADLFDDELDAATELCKKGFTRGAGAVAGVVLEKHLSHVCDRHGLKSKKKHESINDLNQILKDAEVIDIPTWRFIQHLGDIRNLCDHDKKQEPSKENVTDFIYGVSKITKTLF